jgi:hypothetical protein
VTRREIIDAIGDAMEDLNPAAASVEIELVDQDISPHDRLVNYDSLTNKLKRFAAELERMRKWVT